MGRGTPAGGKIGDVMVVRFSVSPDTPGIRVPIPGSEETEKITFAFYAQITW